MFVRAHVCTQTLSGSPHPSLSPGWPLGGQGQDPQGHRWTREGSRERARPPASQEHAWALLPGRGPPDTHHCGLGLSLEQSICRPRASVGDSPRRWPQAPASG